MRILQLTTHLNIGGIASYVLLLSKALKRKGVETIVASSGGNMEDEFKRCGIIHKHLDINTKFEFHPKVFVSAFEAAKIIRNEKIDLMHAHTQASQVAAYFASRIAGVPYITTCHGFFKKRLGRILFDFWGDKVIAVSKPVRASLINDFKVSADRVELIYNGVDLDKFSRDFSSGDLEDIKRGLGLGDSPVIGTIGRLSPVKGHRFFIEAVKRISSAGHKVKGVIIGSGPQEEELKKLVADLGIDDSFRFFGSTSDTAKYLAIMDVFVFPSIKEGLGLSLLEAMASGTPCVASDIGGIPDIINDGENGILFEVGDVEGLSSSIIQLLGDRELNVRLGRSGKMLIREKFSLDSMADKVLNLYNKVLSHYEIL